MVTSKKSNSKNKSLLAVKEGYGNVNNKIKERRQDFGRPVFFIKSLTL